MAFKTVEDARAALEEALPVIPSRYERGVKRADWHSAASSDVAEKNYADGVSRAIATKRRQAKIKAMTNDDWQTAAVEKGARIIGDRVRGALDKYAKNFGDVYSKALDEFKRLPPRTTDWKANITNRLMKTVEAWKKAAGKL